MVVNAKNEGFWKPNNHALSLTITRFFCMVNDDVVVPKGWLEILKAPFATNQNSVFSCPDGGCSALDDMCRGQFGAKEYCEGACLLVDTAIAQKHGLFEPLPAPAYCEDAHASLRFRELGYKLNWVDLKIQHVRGATSRRIPEWRQWYRTNQLFMRKRWASYLKTRIFPHETMKITAITATCHRPEAWALCEKYMAYQTRQPDQWLVLDDDATPTVCTMGQEYHYWPELAGKGSMTKKIKRAIQTQLIKGDIIIIWENDDWYAPTYIAWCEQQLARYSLIGEGRALYYNVQHRWWFDHGNMQHASLCSTAMTKHVLPHLLRQCFKSDDPFIDDRLWKNCNLPKMVFDPLKTKQRLTIGIKSMPGRKGYGSGHDKDSGWAIRDPGMDKLRELLGPTAENYAGFYEVPPPIKIIQQPVTMPKVEVHLVAYNEEDIIPYALRHYKTFASRIIVHDAGSTDRTKAICEEYGAEVQDWDTKGEINDELLRILKETCWNGTTADWVIMVDADELIYFPAGVERSLRLYDLAKLAVITCKGFEMESPVFPTTKGQIYEEVNYGASDDRWYGKPALLRPKLIKSIHYVHGAHGCEVTLTNGRKIKNPPAPNTNQAYLLHYKHLGSVERIGDRYDGNKSRFSEVNKKHGFGWHGLGIVHSKAKRQAILSKRRKIL